MHPEQRINTYTDLSHTLVSSMAANPQDYELAMGIARSSSFSPEIKTTLLGSIANTEAPKPEQSRLAHFGLMIAKAAGHSPAGFFMPGSAYRRSRD